MGVIKCKICGASLDITNDSTVATCSYCGSNQPIPNLDSEKKTDLYDLADHHRRNNDFDKAKEIYEKILQEDITDSVAYWSIILCDYGITYVDDPRTGKKVLTVNRTQKKNVVFDENYKSAIKYSDEAQKKLYEEEARKIDEVQKKILDICAKEEPFDVFICYKNSDENGNNTKDRDIGFKLYNEMTREGLKVFFACVTLEDKMGQEYEP